MSFWTSEKIKQKQPNLNLIYPYNEKRVKHAAYELSLGDEAFITSSKTGKKEIIPEREQIVIEPGQFGLLITKEIITIPEDTIGFISIKAGIKFRGLINVSGFHVDPGFRGYLKFSVYNAGSKNIVLDLGKPVFLIWFCSLDEPTTDTYSGTHAGMEKITKDNVADIQGEVASPGALNKRLKNTEEKLDVLNNKLNEFRSLYVSIMIGIAITVIGGIIVWGFTQALNNTTMPLQNSTNKNSMKQSASVNTNVNIEEAKDNIVINKKNKKGIKNELENLAEKNIDDTQKTSSTTENILPQTNIIKPNQNLPE